MNFSKVLAKVTARPAEELDAAALHLVADAQAAARLRSYRTDANVAALTIERTRDRLDRWGWLFLFAGLAYTTVNVQAFVAGDAAFPDLRWLTAWLVEPMVMGLMLVLLRGEQIANRYKERAGRWVQVTRWAALLITYVMNTGTYYGQGAVGEIFIHSVPVVLVFLAAEALVQQRLVLTTVVDGLWSTPSVQRRALDSESVDDHATVVETSFVPAITTKLTQNTPDELTEPRTLKERAYDAFCELAVEMPIEEIGPAAVDKRAGVRPGTAKVSGRMDEFRARWAREHGEVSDDVTEREEDAG